MLIKHRVYISMGTLCLLNFMDTLYLLNSMGTLCLLLASCIYTLQHCDIEEDAMILYCITGGRYDFMAYC